MLKENHCPKLRTLHHWNHSSRNRSSSHQDLVPKHRSHGQDGEDLADSSADVIFLKIQHSSHPSLWSIPLKWLVILIESTSQSWDNSPPKSIPSESFNRSSRFGSVTSISPAGWWRLGWLSVDVISLKVILIPFFACLVIMANVHPLHLQR